MKLLLGLGGNLGDPPRAFQHALDGLVRICDEVVSSRLYRSAAVGPPQPRFWNMAAKVEVSRPLVEMLEECQALERAAGRDRSSEERWGPRVLDIDLLMVPGLVHRGPRLILPHPAFSERAFALVPAAQLAPGWVHPIAGKTLLRLAAEAVASSPDVVPAGALESRR